MSRRAGYRYGEHGLVPLAAIAEAEGRCVRSVTGDWSRGFRKFKRAFSVTRRDEAKLLMYVGFLMESWERRHPIQCASRECLVASGRVVI